MTKAELDRLQKVIQEIRDEIARARPRPLASKLTPGYDLERKADSILAGVSHDIRLLAAKAKLGDVESIEALRQIGVEAAAFLEHLNLEPEDQQNWIDRFPFQHHEPAITLESDDPWDALNAIIQRESDFIRSLNPGEIRDTCEKSIDYDFGVYLRCNAILDGEHYAPCEAPEQREAETKAASVDAICASRMAWDEVVRRRGARDPKEVAGDRSLNVFRDMVNGLIRTSLLEIMRSNSQKNLRMLAACSISWPIVGEAWQEEISKLPDKVDELKLGASLPFKIRRSVHRGRAREFGMESSTLFVLSLSCELSRKKSLYPEPTAQERKSLEHADSVLDQARENKDALNESEVVILDGHKIVWDRSSHWILKAILLPDFRDCDDSRDFKSGANALWLQALMAHAEHLCEGAWDGYPWWPPPVVQRAGVDKKLGATRGTRQAVKEFVEKGLLNLIKETP